MQQPILRFLLCVLLTTTVLTLACDDAPTAPEVAPVVEVPASVVGGGTIQVKSFWASASGRYRVVWSNTVAGSGQVDISPVNGVDTLIAPPLLIAADGGSNYTSGGEGLGVIGPGDSNNHKKSIEGQEWLSLVLSSAGSELVVGANFKFKVYGDSSTVEIAALAGGALIRADTVSYAPSTEPRWIASYSPSDAIDEVRFKSLAGRVSVMVNRSGTGLTVEESASSGGGAFPSEVPDTLPQSLGVVDPSYGTSLNQVLMAFEPGLSPSAKDSVLAQYISGAFSILGGAPLSASGLDGYYAVEIPTQTSTVDLLDLVDLVQADPSVVISAPVFEAEDLWRVPDDGPGFDPSDWALGTPAGVSSSGNWHLEQVLAPLAWGCEVGDPAARIGIIDRGFPTSGGDVLPNLDQPGSGAFSTIHGLGVAAMAAAKGNNNNLLTGVMWNAGVATRERPTTSSGAALPLLEDLARAGEKVINMSFGARSRPSTVLDATRERALQRGVEPYLDLLEKLDDDGLLPLLVIAAGNDAVDAKWAAFPTLRDDFITNVLVVGGTSFSVFRPDSTVDLWGTAGSFDGTNRGALVDIVAPGQTLTLPDGAGSTRTANGTSYSAPMVAGVAGLLLSAQPSLSPSQLRVLILQGAVEGGFRGVDGADQYLFLNAYEALRASARAAGGPICGGGYFVRGRDVLVQRTNSWELVASASFDVTGAFVVPGGGLVVENGAGQQEQITLQAGGWISQPVLNPIPRAAGSANTLSVPGQRRLTTGGWERVAATQEFVNGGWSSMTVEVFDSTGALLSSVSGLPLPGNPSIFPGLSVTASPASDDVLVFVQRDDAMNPGTPVVRFNTSTQSQSTLGTLPGIAIGAYSIDGSRIAFTALVGSGSSCEAGIRELPSLAPVLPAIPGDPCDGLIGIN